MSPGLPHTVPSFDHNFLQPKPLALGYLYEPDMSKFWEHIKDWGSVTRIEIYHSVTRTAKALVQWIIDVIKIIKIIYNWKLFSLIILELLCCLSAGSIQSTCWLITELTHLKHLEPGPSIKRLEFRTLQFQWCIFTYSLYIFEVGGQTCKLP